MINPTPQCGEWEINIIYEITEFFGLYIMYMNKLKKGRDFKMKTDGLDSFLLIVLGLSLGLYPIVPIWVKDLLSYTSTVISLLMYLRLFLRKF